jgi:hypothetical protein
MPIRFRCAYCNQLLGIARRKAGTVVRCPTCAGQVIVPNVEFDDSESGNGGEEPLVFERSDFEELLNPNQPAGAQERKRQAILSSSESPVALPMATEPPPGAWGTHAEPAFDVSRITPPSPAGPSSPAGGIVLSPARATFLLTVVVVTLALVFGLGFLLGYFLRPASADAKDIRSARPVSVVSSHQQERSYFTCSNTASGACGGEGVLDAG